MSPHPMAHKIIKPKQYRLAVDTNIAETFERFRAEQAKKQPATVRQIRGK